MKRVLLILTLMCLVPLAGCSLLPNANFAKQNLKNWELHAPAARKHYNTLEEDSKKIRNRSLDSAINLAKKAVETAK